MHTMSTAVIKHPKEQIRVTNIALLLQLQLEEFGGVDFQGARKLKEPRKILDN